MSSTELFGTLRAALVRSRRDQGGQRSHRRLVRLSRLHRWRLNMCTGVVREERLSDLVTEFGIINPNHGGAKHRYTYAAQEVPRWFLFGGLVKT
ncbi:hypothetical protein B2J88_50775 [Rhodococcus sp. SRB_17]|nr:hypothetical protein [Rhodococcus sp. SRB_17]